MKIKICADSTCDLSKELIEKFDITIVPLYVVMDGADRKDGVDISPSDIFEHVDGGGEMPKTAAVNVVDYEEVFGKLAKEYDEIIHLDISNHFSSCNQNAHLAAEKYPNVHVVDTLNLSTGSGLVVLRAAELAKSGMTAKDIVSELERIIPKVEASFVVDRMDYLQKGGRCSSIVALSAKVLRIKPTIEVIGGKMSVGKKYQGSFSRALKKYVEDRLSGRDDIDYRRIFITHTPCKDGIAHEVRALIKEHGQFEEIIETTAGCTISTHCGPSTLGILFVKK